MNTTKQAIYDAFISIYRRKPFDKMSVKELCIQTPVARTTFYEYYDNLGTLKAEIEDELIGGILKIAKETAEGNFAKMNLNVFFSHLQEQNDDIAGWSESTVNKIKQVLTKVLVEVEILDTFKSTRLNPMFLCEELEEGIRRNNDLEALAAFNCFR